MRTPRGATGQPVCRQAGVDGTATAASRVILVPAPEVSSTMTQPRVGRSGWSRAVQTLLLLGFLVPSVGAGAADRVIGASVAHAAPLADGEPNSWAWAPNMSQRRSGHSATLLPD